MCGLCARACESLGTGAIAAVGRGMDKGVSTPYSEPSAVCVGCGGCAAACPTGAMSSH
ncbi:MAG: 4Fe-4S dicluster domain-containing protein [Kiritimatiellaeota bacterium]|nr:4Fe-4S dicluster domain-containing protein [Kiritimatiellota bacterium]